MIPCIVNKCILYPLCLNKTNISCSTLYDYFNQLVEHGLWNEDIWNVIHRKLKAMIIHSHDEPLIVSNKHPIPKQFETFCTYNAEPICKGYNKWIKINHYSRMVTGK